MGDERTNIYSIQARRTQNNLRARRGGLSDAERIAELEVDVDKLISLVLQQQNELDDIQDRQWKLLRLISARLGGKPKRKSDRTST